MPKNVGKYQQGHILTHGEFGETDMDPDDFPSRAAPAGMAPPNQIPVREEHKAAPNNDGHKV